MRKAIFLLIAITSFSYGFTQNFIEERVGLNNDFIKTINQNPNSNFIPSPVNYRFSETATLRNALSLPSKFDSRDLGIVPAVRDQGSVNTCWTFSNLDALQISWAKMNLSNEPYSTENLANCHGFVPAKNNGGNADMAVAYLARFSGPYKETADPYINNTTGTCNTSLTKNDKGACMAEAIKIPKQTQIIKQMVYRYGAVLTAANSNALQYRYNFSTYATFTPDSTGLGAANHAGAIIGWDDDYVVSIPGYDSPTNPGAWIVRNTLGTDSDNQGYYYASYEDYYIGSSATVFTKRIEKETIDSVYTSDKLGITTGITGNIDSIYSLSKFTTPSAQVVKYIGIYTQSAKTTVDINIYANKSGETLSTILGFNKGVFLEYPGYHTIPVSADVNGDFYIRVKYKTQTGVCILPIEASITNYADVDVKPTGSQWFNFTESNSLDTFRTVGSGVREYNLCLKVYTSNNTNNLSATVDKEKACINETITFENKTAGSFDSYYWDLGEGATPATTTTNSISETVSVQYSSAGTKNITLKGITASDSDSIQISSIIEVTDGVPIYFNDITNNFTQYKNKTITIKAYGAESYEWISPSEINGITEDSVVVNVGEADSYVKLQGTIGSCIGTDSILITVVEDCAPYDDIEDAKTLSLETTEGPFINNCATWEINEPIPPATDCVSQTGWCLGEDNLHNTLWFKFTAPNSGKVNITTTGMDNKIALYNAKSTGTYLDIISGDNSKYELIAANDDKSKTEVAATISNATGLTAGSTYWIQLDGSYNGSIGDSYITVSDANSSPVEENSINNIIISNPARNGLLAIRNASAIKSIKLIDLTGTQLIQADHDSSQTLNLNLQMLNEGHYILRIETENGYRAEKILLTK